MMVEVDAVSIIALELLNDSAMYTNDCVISDCIGIFGVAILDSLLNQL